MVWIKTKHDEWLNAHRIGVIDVQPNGPASWDIRAYDSIQHSCYCEQDAAGYQSILIDSRATKEEAIRAADALLAKLGARDVVADAAPPSSRFTGKRIKWQTFNDGAFDDDGDVTIVDIDSAAGVLETWQGDFRLDNGMPTEGDQDNRIQPKALAKLRRKLGLPAADESQPGEAVAEPDPEPEAQKPDVDWVAFGEVSIIDPEGDFLVYREVLGVDDSIVRCCSQGELLKYRLSDGENPTAKGYRIAPADLASIQAAVGYKPKPALGEDEVRVVWTESGEGKTAVGIMSVGDGCFTTLMGDRFCQAFNLDTGRALQAPIQIHPDDPEKARAWAKAREPKAEPVKVRWIDNGLECEDVVQVPRVEGFFPGSAVSLDGWHFDEHGVSVTFPDTKYIHPADLPAALAEAARLRKEAGR